MNPPSSHIDVAVHIIDEDQEVCVPPWVRSIETFQRWVDADDFPEHWRISWIKGNVHVDLCREQIFTHNGLKTELSAVLYGLIRGEQLGRWFGDGVMLSNFAADIAGVPDGMFVSKATLQSDRIRLLEGKQAGFVEIQGAPDIVLEVVSRSSIQKDTVLLRQAYWEADIPEYWLIDGRKEPLQFDIFRHTKRGYTATRKADGWIKSSVLGKAFRLTQQADDLGHPLFTLAVR